MKKAYLMVGVSGCGKSSIVEKIVEHYAGVKVFSLDRCRLDLLMLRHFGDPLITDVYAAAFKYATENPVDFNSFVTSVWQEVMKADVIVIDNTNLTRKSRARWINDVRGKGFQIAGIEVYTPLQVVLDRQVTRGDKSVPESVVRNMFMTQQSLLLGSEVDALVTVNGTDKLKYPF
jgi:predicted kinase